MATESGDGAVSAKLRNDPTRPIAVTLGPAVQNVPLTREEARMLWHGLGIALARTLPAPPVYVRAGVS